MKRTHFAIQRHTQTLAWSLSVLIAVLAPATYFFLSYQYLRGVLEAQTALQSQDVERIILANPNLWRYEELRLTELIERRSTVDATEAIRITDTAGEVIAQNSVAVAPLYTAYVHNIYDAGSVIAYVKAYQSLVPLVNRTLLVGAGSTVIAVLIFLIFSTVPLRTVRSAVRALSESEHKYRSLYESMKEGLVIHRVTRDGSGGASLSIVDANNAFLAMLGSDLRQLVGSDSLALFGTSLGERLAELLQIEERSGSLSFELALPYRDGTYLVHAFSPGQGLIATLIEDITARKKAEEERLDLERRLLHAQKLESLGILSGGIAHDFNNLMHALLGNLDIALMRFHGNDALRKHIDQAITAGKQAAKLTDMMLAYTGKKLFIMKHIDLTALVRKNASLLAASIPRSITFDSALDDGLPLVNADEGQLQQVVMNLITNASEAIGDDAGTIRLATGLREFDQPTLDASRVEEKLSAGRYVFLEVTDNGCGMDAGTLHKLFDPFFTTKFTGRGLGMSAVLGIIRGHRGAFLVESSPGAGTAIRILLPIVEPAQAELPVSTPAVHAPAAEYGRHPARVLIVDDEEMVRQVAAAMLKELGVGTMEATGGEEALRILRAQGQGIDLVLLDHNMPLMDGVAAFREMKKVRPDIKILLASGYSEKEVSERFSGLGLNGFIQKPYNLQGLSAALRRSLQD